MNYLTLNEAYQNYIGTFGIRDGNSFEALSHPIKIKNMIDCKNENYITWINHLAGWHYHMFKGNRENFYEPVRSELSAKNTFVDWDSNFKPSVYNETKRFQAIVEAEDKSSVWTGLIDRQSMAAVAHANASIHVQEIYPDTPGVYTSEIKETILIDNANTTYYADEDPLMEMNLEYSKTDLKPIQRFS